MTIKVTLLLLPTGRERKTVELKDRATVEDAIRAIGLLPDGWIAMRDNAPIPSDERLVDGEELRLFGVVSGG